MVSASTSLDKILMSDYNFDCLNEGSHNIIKKRLEVIRIRLGSDLRDFSKLAECITGSKVLKKVILDGLNFINVSGKVKKITALKRVVEACKKKNTVELWKENLAVNGKVDLDADIVSFLSSFNPWIAPYG